MNYNSLSLRQFRDYFSSLAAPDPASLRGQYPASFVGPAWLRVTAAPGLVPLGFGGWWGKDFSEDGAAINIFLRAGKFSRRFPMKFIRAPSFVDGKDGLALRYPPGNPFPWTHVVDELRRIDESTLLGMTIPNISGLRGIALPFILQKQEGNKTRGFPL
jgi:hypothetical protein